MLARRSFGEVASSVVSAVDLENWDREAHHAAFNDLRTARKLNRVAQVDRFDAFYKTYVTALFSAVVIYSAAGLFGDDPIRGAGLADVRHLGPAYLGVVVALAIAIGLRSGGRGGPLALEQADVRHVLLSPVDRRDSIRGPALRQLRYGVFLGSALGGIVGLIAVRRLPDVPALWVVCGMAFGAATMLGAYGVAMLASGRRVSRPITDTLAFLVLAWAGFDAYSEMETSPFSWLGHVALWPDRLDLMGLLGIAVMVALGVLGITFVDGWSLEVAERRSKLVGQLRFAATLQDVRTVMVLQRQLAQDHLKVRPWIRLPAVKRAFKKDGAPMIGVFYRRSFGGLLRWPFFRGLRLLVLAVIAGFAVCGAWAGTTPLIVVTGVCLWIISLDLLEGLAQDTDRPDRLRSMGRDPGWVLGRHLIVPLFVLFMLVLVGSIPAVVLGDPDVVQGVLFSTVVACTVLPMGGAALAIARQPTIESGSVQSPEVAGVMMLWKLVMPPGLGVLALVPLMFARNDWLKFHDLDHMLRAMNTPWYCAIAAGAWANLWIRYGNEFRDRMELNGARFTRGPETEKK